MGDEYTPIGFHHYYTGLLISLVGFPMIFYGDHWIDGAIVAFIGFSVAIEDGIQHIIQRYRPDYRSPINRVYWKFVYYMSSHTTGWMHDFWEWVKRR